MHESKNGEIQDQRTKVDRRTELEAFAEVLADDEDKFAASLERLDLKRSANNEIFDLIKVKFLAKMGDDQFKERNATHFKKGTKPTNLALGLDKLSGKYKWLKKEWIKKTKRAPNCSGLAPGEEPRMDQILNPEFSDTSGPIRLTSSALDTSFLNENDSEEEKNAESDPE